MLNVKTPKGTELQIDMVSKTVTSTFGKDDTHVSPLLGDGMTNYEGDNCKYVSTSFGNVIIATEYTGEWADEVKRISDSKKSAERLRELADINAAYALERAEDESARLAQKYGN